MTTLTGVVTPAKAGVQALLVKLLFFGVWIPAFAGMTPLLAFDGPGTTSNPFLKIPLSARATALGGAFGAIAGDVATIDYNPAGLAGLSRTDVQANYLNYIEDTSLQSLLIGFPLRLSAAPKFEPLEGVEFTPGLLNIGLEYRQFKAEDTTYSALGVKGSNFDVRDQLIGVGLAYPILPRTTIGATGKYISTKVQDKSVTNYAADIGVLSRFSSRLNLAASIQNMGASKALDKESDPLPTLLRAGAVYKNSAWLFSADLSEARDGVLRKASGVEWSLNNIVKLRGGVSHDNTIQFSGGLGIEFKGPQKAAAPAYRPPSSHNSGAAPSSAVSQQIVARSVDKLTRLYLQNRVEDQKQTLAVVPIATKDKAGTEITKLFQENFSHKSEFAVIHTSNGQIPDTELMMTAVLERKDDKYAITARLIQRDNAEILANDYAEIAVEDLQVHPTLGNADKVEEDPSAAPSHIQIGLDYGLATREDLGISHNVTLRVLY